MDLRTPLTSQTDPPTLLGQCFAMRMAMKLLDSTSPGAVEPMALAVPEQGKSQLPCPADVGRREAWSQLMTAMDRLAAEASANDLTEAQLETLLTREP